MNKRQFYRLIKKVTTLYSEYHEYTASSANMMKKTLRSPSGKRLLKNERSMKRIYENACRCLNSWDDSVPCVCGVIREAQDKSRKADKKNGTTVQKYNVPYTRRPKRLGHVLGFTDLRKKDTQMREEIIDPLEMFSTMFPGANKECIPWAIATALLTSDAEICKGHYGTDRTTVFTSEKEKKKFLKEHGDHIDGNFYTSDVSGPDDPDPLSESRHLFTSTRNPLVLRHWAMHVWVKIGSLYYCPMRDRVYRDGTYADTGEGVSYYLNYTDSIDWLRKPLMEVAAQVFPKNINHQRMFCAINFLVWCAGLQGQTGYNDWERTFHGLHRAAISGEDFWRDPEVTRYFLMQYATDMASLYPTAIVADADGRLQDAHHRYVESVAIFRVNVQARIWEQVFKGAISGQKSPRSKGKVKGHNKKKKKKK